MQQTNEANISDLHDNQHVEHYYVKTDWKD